MHVPETPYCYRLKINKPDSRISQVIVDTISPIVSTMIALMRRILYSIARNPCPNQARTILANSVYITVSQQSSDSVQRS